MNEITYGRIRGSIPEARCTKKGPYGSALYCDCGCQTPHDEDPKIDLDGITVGERVGGERRLKRNGETVGWVNTQYMAITLNNHEYLGVKSKDLEKLIAAAPKTKLPTTTAGSTLAETAANEAMVEKFALAEQDERYKNHPGYCNKCHTFCYGDCTA